MLLPALQDGFARYHDHERAMLYAWHVGLVVLVLVGVFKIACAPLGNAVRRLVPRAGLLGSLAAIALALIAFLPLAEKDGIAAVPVVGLAALVVILVTLVAHRQLPGKFPGALAAVIVGVAIFQAMYWLGRWQNWPLAPPPDSGRQPALWQPASLWSFYGADARWWADVFWAAVAKLPVVAAVRPGHDRRRHRLHRERGRGRRRLRHAGHPADRRAWRRWSPACSVA